MTPKEAIECLNIMKLSTEDDSVGEIKKEVCDMAIEALEKQIDVDKALKFIENYAFKDSEEIYTNGTILVPLFRVKQAIIDKAYNGLFEG